MSDYLKSEDRGLGQVARTLSRGANPLNLLPKPKSKEGAARGGGEPPKR
jgi:hypothetical protein